MELTKSEVLNLLRSGVKITNKALLEAGIHYAYHNHKGELYYSDIHGNLEQDSGEVYDALYHQKDAETATYFIITPDTDRYVDFDTCFGTREEGMVARGGAVIVGVKGKKYVFKLHKEVEADDLVNFEFREK